MYHEGASRRNSQVAIGETRKTLDEYYIFCCCEVIMHSTFFSWSRRARSVRHAESKTAHRKGIEVTICIIEPPLPSPRTHRPGNSARSFLIKVDLPAPEGPATTSGRGSCIEHEIHHTQLSYFPFELKVTCIA